MTGCHRLGLALSALPLLTLLGGCGLFGAAPPSPPAQIAEARRDYVPGVSPIYCYRTLATADCYAGPQDGPPNRLIGSIE